jgi:hypothetical protein
VFSLLKIFPPFANNNPKSLNSKLPPTSNYKQLFFLLSNIPWHASVPWTTVSQFQICPPLSCIMSCPVRTQEERQFPFRLNGSFSSESKISGYCWQMSWTPTSVRSFHMAFVVISRCWGGGSCVWLEIFEHCHKDSVGDLQFWYVTGNYLW